ncbi:uncharacterized protein LOC125383226 [Haliotis rufescens]|uniref:uncharacterized protein LOC125383226 n=1 Tax=Haliotis rufescens TaxID=6454 RepID=UPI00201F958E|nr:uncharacterized protein LOC125383226 [Haliotis rufescens]
MGTSDLENRWTHTRWSCNVVGFKSKNRSPSSKPWRHMLNHTHSSAPQLASNVALNAHLNRLWSAVVSKGTQTAYSTGMTCYIKFLLTFGLFQTMFYHRLPPVNEVYLQYFIAHCYGVLQLKHVTVKTYLAGVRFFYLQRGIITIFDHRGSGALNRLQSIMRGYKKLQAPTSRKGLPITYTVLARIVCTLHAGVLGPLNDLVMECMCLTAFFRFLRCGEITCTARFDPSANICLSDIKFDFAKRKCTILLKASKTDPFQVGVPIILFSNSSLCPFSSLRKLFHTRTLQRLRRLESSGDQKYKHLFKSTHPYLCKLGEFGVTFFERKLSLISNEFWKSCFQSFIVLDKKIKPESFSSFLTEPIFYNPNIKINRKSFFLKYWFEKGVSQIIDLVKANKEFLSYEEFNDMYGICSYYLEFYGVVSSVKQYLGALNLVPTDSVEDQRCVVKTICSSKSGSKHIYFSLVSTEVKTKGQEKLELRFENLNWNNIYNKIFSTTQDVKLRWFQYKITHRILTTNTFLYLLTYPQNDLCSFCHNEKETITHLFWECDIIKQFWDEVSLWIDQCFHVYNMTFCAELILFGVQENIKTDKVMVIGYFNCATTTVLTRSYLIYQLQVNHLITFIFNTIS